MQFINLLVDLNLYVQFDERAVNFVLKKGFV